MKKKIIIISILVIILGYFVVTTKIGADITKQELAACEKVVIPNSTLDFFDVTSLKMLEYFKDFSKDSYYKIDSEDELTIYIKPEQKAKFEEEIRSLVYETIKDFELQNENSRCICNDDLTDIKIYTTIDVRANDFIYLVSWIDFGAELINLVEGKSTEECVGRFDVYNADTQYLLISFGHNEVFSIDDDDWQATYPEDSVVTTFNEIVWTNLKISEEQYYTYAYKYRDSFISFVYIPDTNHITMVSRDADELSSAIQSSFESRALLLKENAGNLRVEVNSNYTKLLVYIDKSCDEEAINSEIVNSIIDCELYQLFVSPATGDYALEIQYYDSNTGNLLGELNFPEDEFKIITSK